MIQKFENFLNEDKKYDDPSKEDKEVMNLIKGGLKDKAKNLDLYGDGNKQVLFFEVGDLKYKLTLSSGKKGKSKE